MIKGVISSRILFLKSLLFRDIDSPSRTTPNWRFPLKKGSDTIFSGYSKLSDPFVFRTIVFSMSGNESEIFTKQMEITCSRRKVKKETREFESSRSNAPTASSSFAVKWQISPKFDPSISNAHIALSKNSRNQLIGSTK